MSLKDRWIELANGEVGALEVAFNIIQDLDIDPRERELDVSVNKYGIMISIPYNKVPREGLQALKRSMKLEVPSWAETYQEKPICGDMVLRDSYNDENGKWHPAYGLTITLGGAFVCKPTERKREIPPPEYVVKEATNLLKMTPEEALAHVQAEAARMIAPREVPVYECAPAPSEE